ncbi:MAG: glycoside hydrolase family 38 C-terminal domain-containing protein [Phycisphaerales bacterium]
MKTFLAFTAVWAIGTAHTLAIEPGAPAPDSAVPVEQPKAANPPAAPEMPDLAKQPTLFVVGYSHLDTQWRWTYADTIREFIPNTLNDNFALFEKYPSYVFNFSGSRRYKMMEEYYPTEFQKLKGYVAAGRWFPCGSSVDENDANVPSAEALVRQVLYGNRYFRQTFGVASEEYMLPDCFGFPAALPSVLAHCGVKGFSTQKLTWGGVVPIPFKVGVWEGPDGHSVTAALDPGAYVGQVRENLANSNGWKERIAASGKISGVLADYHYFGTGDQGGAPGESSVAKVQESVGTNGAIKVISGPADWLFKAITPEMEKKLPRYKGELMLTEHSAGSISSQAYMKRWNRKNELLAGAAERAALAAAWLGGRSYPSQKIEDAWYLVLGSQMHDILPGTSVPKAYDYSWNDEILAANQFAAILEDSVGVVASAMNTQATGTPIVIYNPLSGEREDVVEADVPAAIAGAKGVKVIGPDGKTVPAQVLSSTGNTARVAFLAKAPSIGFAAFDVQLTSDAPASGSESLKVQDRLLENEMYTVRLDDNGDVASIFDKQAKRELLSAPARLGLHYENPRQWPAWNQDWADRQLPAKAYVSGPVTFRIVEQGPARVAIEVTRECEGSTFVQTIRLASGGAAARVEFDNQIDWRSRQRSLRAAFPLVASNPKATYDIQTGAIERGNGHPKQYEYPFHQWFDLTDAKGDYGVTVMCDSKFAADKPDDHTVRLTLLHTPGTRGGYPDQGSQDLGRHRVQYAVYSHTGDWRKAEGFAQAARLNQPLLAFIAPAHEGALGKTFSLANTSSPAVSISAAKKAEDGDEIIVRLREHTGGPVKGVQISAARPILSAREVDGQEREIAKATVQDGKLVADINGYELRAYAVKLGDAPAKVAQLESAPVTLPFDADVVSTNTNRKDGAMTDKGLAIPAEQFPASCTAEGVKYTFGSGADGQKNAVTCRGQEISLPSGNFDRLYILAAANEDTQSNLTVGGKEVPFNVQNWSGYVGQWDHRVWANDDGKYSEPSGDIVGIDAGYVKPDSVAWYCSHHHIPTGDSYYEYCYIFKYAVDLPAGAKSFKLPDDSRIKVFAASVAKVGSTRATAARPVFDTLDDRSQDRPRFAPASGKFADATTVKIEPGLYGRTADIRYTIDGSEPTAKSTAYRGPIPVSATTNVKAIILGAGGRPGPAAASTFEVDDRTAPTVTRVDAMFKSSMVLVQFSEPVDPSTTLASSFTVEPAISISKAELRPDRRSVQLTLASSPEAKRPYHLKINGVKDASSAANVIKPVTMDFTVAGPVYTLSEVTREQRGKAVRDVPGLPVKAGDAWTVNMFVRTDKQPDNRTIIAGFGKCEQADAGSARYLVKFANGVQFWSHNRDVPSRTQLDLNRWQMLTATYDGKTLRIYKDGKSIGEREVQLADDENVVQIAPKDPWEQKRQFDGDIRDLTIWGSALSDEGIAALKLSMPQ